MVGGAEDRLGEGAAQAESAYDVPDSPPVSDSEATDAQGDAGATSPNRSSGAASKHDHGASRRGHRHSDAAAEPASGLFGLGHNARHEAAPECLEPFRYISKTPGKNVRSMMIDCFQLWLAVPEEKITVIKQIVGLLHNASLLIDDIEDDSKLRRGQPVAHMVYGIPQTLNCANYVYFLAMEKCLALGSPDALQLFTHELLNLHRGQGRELFWRDTSSCPTEEEYIGMVEDKTGGLFRLGVGLLQCFATRNASTDYTRLVNLLAVYFQMRDDLINLASSEYQVNKSFCEDITEGKYSFPVIHGILASPQGDNRIAAILKQRTENRDLKMSVVKLLREETHSFRYVKEVLDRIELDIEREIRDLGGSSELTKLMARLKLEVEACEL